MKKLRSAYVEKPIHGRRLVISDIHGCSKTFKKLLKQVELTKDDQLFILGDAINKGPHSDKVLNRILKLKAQGYSVFFLRGNHEQIILNTKNKALGQQKRILKSLKALNLLEGKTINPTYFELLKKSFHFIETDKHFLVHAGFNDKENTYLDKKAMLQIRSFEYDAILFKNKQIIVGHTPLKFEKIQKRINKKKSIICIDNGCVNYNIEGQGKLICFNLDENTIHTQSYCEA